MEQASRKRKASESSSSEALQTTAIAPTIAPKHDQLPESESSESTTEPTPTGINRLIFDCLHLIFLRLPLHTLLKIRRVSRTWNSTVIYICARKERLTLTVYNPIQCYSWLYARINPLVPLDKRVSDLFWIDDLGRYVLDRTENAPESVHIPIKLLKLTKQSSVGLAQLFPSLTELRFHYDCRRIVPSYLAKIEFLLRHFSSSSSNLRIFSLNIAFNEKKYYSAPTGDVNMHVHMRDALCHIVSNITTGRLPHLKQLDLCIDGHFSLYMTLYSTLDFQAKKYVDMLAKLERFTLNYYSPHWDTKSTLAKLGSSLTSLSLNITDKHHDDFRPLNSMFDNVKFATNLTYLRLSFMQHEASNRNLIRALCERFQELKFVQLQIVSPHPPNHNDVDEQWFQILGTLQHLSELRLHEFDVVLDNSLTLPRVKKLTLCKRDLIVPDLFDANELCRALASQFPNLEELVLVGRPFAGDVNENTRAEEAEQQIRLHFTNLRSTVCDLTAPEWR